MFKNLNGVFQTMMYINVLIRLNWLLTCVTFVVVHTNDCITNNTVTIGIVISAKYVYLAKSLRLLTSN
jgi:hypothetical protein